MPKSPATAHSSKQPSEDKKSSRLDELHWRAAAEEGLRLAAKHWRVPLENITEIALVDADGPRYLFKVLYTNESGQRFTAAVHMPKCMTYTSPLSMSVLCPNPGEFTSQSPTAAVSEWAAWSGTAPAH